MLVMKQNRKVGITGYFLPPGGLVAIGGLHSLAMPLPTKHLVYNETMWSHPS